MTTPVQIARAQNDFMCLYGNKKERLTSSDLRSQLARIAYQYGLSLGDFMYLDSECIPRPLQPVKDYLDWVNNYLTVAKFTEHYGLGKYGLNYVDAISELANK